MDNQQPLQREQSSQEAANTNQYLTFILGNEEYGVDILCVQEIRGWTQVTKLPNTAEHMLGVLNLRGSIVSIIDMRSLFNMSSAEFNSNTVIVLLNVSIGGESRTVGLVVDAISDVYHIADTSIYKAPEVGTAVDTQFIIGLSTVEDKMVILLDADLLVNTGALEHTLEQTPEDIV